MDSSIIIFFSATIIVGALLLAFIGLSKGGKKNLNVEYYRTEWLKIENRISREDVSSHQICVMNADKLVDKALREKGLRGTNMGERMKSAKDIFTNRNSVWDAHKLRNKIAHEPGFTPKYDDVRHALSGYKQALKDLGAI